MEQEALKQQLEEFCQRQITASGRVSAIERLSGGANMESWRFTFDGEALVLRRLPPGMPVGGGDNEAVGLGAALPLDDQATLIDLAAQNGVMAPQIRARLSASDGLGEGFVMACMPGEALPYKLLGKPDFAEAFTGLYRQWAEQLAAIHAIPLDALPASIKHRSPAQMLSELRASYKTLGGQSPIYALAFGWLRQHLPDPAPPVLCHGDFRMGNLLITPDGLSAVLDWELAHIGDPAEDLAYGCMPSWRFGHYHNTLGGFADVQPMLKAYEALTGRTISGERFRFWLIYATLWWGVCCLSMAQIWRSGGDRSVERVVIGRRFSEVEVDLLLLLESYCPQPSGPVDLPPVHASDPGGKPDQAELLDALYEWVEARILPEVEGHTRFEARVALNGLAMAQREARLGAGLKHAEVERLKALGLTPATLHDNLAENGTSGLSGEILSHLKALALGNCAVDQPRYAGLIKARKQWSGA